MQLQQIDVTGARLVGAITKELGMNGPKHHAVVLGKDIIGGEVYIAELMTNGRQITTYRNFYNRYAPNGPIRIEPNPGARSNAQVAQHALAEVEQDQSDYDLITNNCESFANRATFNNSTSTQVVNTTLGIVILGSLYFFLKGEK